MNTCDTALVTFFNISRKLRAKKRAAAGRIKCIPAYMETASMPVAIYEQRHTLTNFEDLPVRNCWDSEYIAFYSSLTREARLAIYCHLIPR